jgi:hypothetical protein
VGTGGFVDRKARRPIDTLARCAELDVHPRSQLGAIMMSANLGKSTFLALMLMCLAGGDVWAQSASEQAKRIQMQSSGAARGSNTATQASGQARGGFDTRATVANPVRAQPVAKPSPVGQPVYSTRTTPGYKPAAPTLRVNPVPPPTVTRSTTTATTPSRTTTSSPSKPK